MSAPYSLQEAKRAPVPTNGVDTPTLFATINAVGADPELANFSSAPRVAGCQAHTARARCTATSEPATS